jgi:IclR family pca regulon transcriptional regulator
MTANPKNTVRSLAKGFKVLEVFTATETQFSLSEIATRSGLDAGTAFRMINTLVQLGYIQKLPQSKKYRLTLKVLDLGFSAIARSDLRTVSRPILRSLVSEINEAASLAALDGFDMVYLERVHAGLSRMGVDVRIGTRLPAYYTAVGQAVLAFLPLESVRRILKTGKRIKITPDTPTTIAEIERQLRSVRKRGYAVADPKVVIGLRVIAAPVLDADGHSLAAISVATPLTNITSKEYVKRMSKPLLKATAEVGKAMQVSGVAESMPYPQAI